MDIDDPGGFAGIFTYSMGDKDISSELFLSDLLDWKFVRGFVKKVILKIEFFV